MRLLGTLRSRLLVSHLAVVFIGVLVVLVVGQRLSAVFVNDHLRAMSRTVGGLAEGDAAELEAGITTALNRALLWAAVVSSAAAMVGATLAAARLLEPLEGVRRVARRLATGSYTERVPVPDVAELAALAADVNALAEALEETESRRLRLISEVAHELRTPVATLKGYLEGLLDGVFQPDDETLGAAIREAARMERLASDLSALSRAEEGRVDMRLESIDLARVAPEVAQRLRPQFNDKGVELIVEPAEMHNVIADRDRVAQILTNLIGNALSYTSSSGLVVVSVGTQDGMAQVAVSDSGRGLTAGQLDQVFDRFYRADRSVVGGTGIGLTLARSLARLQGGDVTVSSAGPDAGSTFVLSLPQPIR